jgi:O-antigen/teichoic acid export membrane protein
MEVVYGRAVDAATRQAIVILLVQVFVAPFSGATRAFFTAREQGYLIALGDLALALGMAVFTAVAVASHLGYRGVVVAVTGGYLAQALVMASIAATRGLRIGFDRRSGTLMLRLALPLAGTLVLNYLYFRLDLLLLSWLKNDVEVARYGLAYRVLEGLMVLPTYVMLALFPSLARSEGDHPRLASTVGAALGGLEAIALPMAALLAIFSPEIVVLLGGHKYADAAPVLAILAVALGISYLNGVFGNALVALGHQRRLLWLTMATLAINLIVNLALIPPWGPVGAATAVVVSEIVALAVVRGFYVRTVGPPSSPPHSRIAIAGSTLGLLAAAKFALPLGSKPLLVVGVGGLLGVLIYSAALLRLGALPECLTNRLPLPTWLIPHPSGR